MATGLQCKESISELERDTFDGVTRHSDLYALRSKFAPDPSEAMGLRSAMFKDATLAVSLTDIR